MRFVAAVARRRSPPLAPPPQHTTQQVASALGFDEGLFGFNPQVELFVGRSAMFGFAAAIVGEFAGKGGALAQLGLETPSTPLLAAIVGATVVAVGAGAARTASRLRSMPPRELARYRSFLGLDKEGDISLAANAMKGIVTPPPAAAPVAAAAEGAEGEAAAAAAPAEPTPAPAPRPAAPQQYPGMQSDLAFAQTIELDNGRAAQLGFLAAIIVEAATGKGILGQLIMYLKATGFLGAASGF